MGHQLRQGRRQAGDRHGARARAQEQDRRPASPRASSSCSRRTRSSGSRAPAASPGSGQVEVTGRAPARIAHGARDHRRHRVVAAERARASTIDKTHIITSDEAIHLADVPKSIAILGSGAVGVEFASIFRRFGSDVTLIELLPRLVPNEDEAVSAELEKAFKKRGIAVRTGDEVTSAKVDRRRRHASRCRSAAGKSRVADGREAAGRHRPRAGDRRAGRRRGRARARSRLHQGRLSCSARTCRASRRSATSSRWAPARTRSSRTCRRPKASSWPSGSPATTPSRSTTTTCRLHLLRSGNRQRRADRGRKRSRAASTSASARSRSACSAARRSPARPRAS